MKRKNGLYFQIATYENLAAAFRKAAKGKQDRAEVILFRKNYDASIRKLREQLLNHTPDIGHYRFFTVHDPKIRKICAASFPERVLHHAIMNICEPVLESFAIHDSYACRKNRGNRKALARGQFFARRFEWYLKMDIRKYFDSVDHEILLSLLSRKFKDKMLLALFRQLFDTYSVFPGKGLPVGNLISQHMANFYMGYLDHWVREVRGIYGYLRYMDDFAVFGTEKEFLKSELSEIRNFLDRKLSLHPKENTRINRCVCGIPFLGFCIYPDKIRLSSSGKRRFVKKFRRYERYVSEGIWTEGELVRHMEPLTEFTRIAYATGFRRNVIRQYGVLS